MRMVRVAAAGAVPWLLAAQQIAVSPILGGLPPGSGVAGGVEFRTTGLARGLVDFRARAIASIRKYEHLDLRLSFPPLTAHSLFAELGFRYRNYPEEDFWGIGPKTPEDHRTTFRMEDIDSTAAFGVRPWSPLRIGARAGFLNTNTGPGKDRSHPSTEERFLPGEAPGLDRQPDFQHLGGFAELDYRDNPADARRGGHYSLSWTRYRDRTLGRFHFRRWDLDLRQFFPSFQRGSTVAVRLAAAFSEKDPGRQVPFFLQPTVGGGNDLRGYHQSRFRDENLLALNLEYRWRAREFVEAVLFTDGGRVFSRPGDFGLAGMRGSLGAGGRLKFGGLLVGLDAAWSPEGLRFWFRGSQLF
jgi:hypothetical protein